MLTIFAALHLRADKAMKESRFKQAVADMQAAMKWPENLGAGRPHNPNYVREYCKLGLCHKALGDKDLARRFFKKAAASPNVTPQPTPDWRRRAAEELERLE